MSYFAVPYRASFFRGNNVIMIRKTLFAALVCAMTTIGCVAVGNPAQACSTTTHCYGDAISALTGVRGASVNISPSCLSTPADSDISNEMWLMDTYDNTPAFVEVGYVQIGSGYSLGHGSYILNTPGRYGFWADQRPGHSDYSVHVLETNPSLSVGGAYVYIRANGTNTWQVSFDGHTSNSTGNYMVPNYVEVGSETTSASGKDYGLGSSVKYLDANGTWHSGMGSPVIDATQAPQKFSWVTKSTSYHAGAPC